MHFIINPNGFSVDVSTAFTTQPHSFSAPPITARNSRQSTSRGEVYIERKRANYNGRRIRPTGFNIRAEARGHGPGATAGRLVKADSLM